MLEVRVVMHQVAEGVHVAVELLETDDVMPTHQLCDRGPLLRRTSDVDRNTSKIGVGIPAGQSNAFEHATAIARHHRANFLQVVSRTHQDWELKEGVERIEGPGA